MICFVLLLSQTFPTDPQNPGKGLQHPASAERSAGLEPLPAFALGARAEYAVPSGWLFITRGSEPGSATALHVDDQIDPEPEYVTSLEGYVRIWENHAVGGRFTPMSLSGTTRDEQPFIFHGTMFDAGRPVKTELDLNLLEVDYRYTLNPGDPVQITTHLGAEIWTFSARLRTIDGLPGPDTTRAFSSAFWMAGLDAAYGLNRFFEVRAFIAGGSERANQYFYEAEADIVARPISQIAFLLGYRIQTLDFRQSTNRSNLHFYSPTAGLEISF